GQFKTHELAEEGENWLTTASSMLDVFHGSIFRTFQSSTRTPYQTTRRLREAGVKFRRKKDQRALGYWIQNGYLEIPKLLIHDGTKSLFSNLIAFEQCHIHSSHNITSYIIFMDNLINSSEDVSYLHHCGIIEHWLGSDSEVADLFNRLCKEVVLIHKIVTYLNFPVKLTRKWNSLKATLRHKYFNNPWAYFSFFAAVTLLVFTFSQSFYAIYAYYKPPPKS
ncbi:hypothetical protein HID58_090268, partial [Brassica napus]